MEKNPTVINAWLRRPDTVCLFLHRRRLLAQAVSFRASLRTGIWDVGGEVTAAPRALPGLTENRETDHLAYRLIAWNGMWRFFFEANDIPTVDLAYEDFVADQSKTIADIAAKLGVPCEVPPPEPYSGSGSTSDDKAQRRYLETWAYPSGEAPPLRYSRRLAIGALIDTTRRGVTRRLRSVPGIFVRRS
jgi:LPS sulfotransferase NodH